MKLHLLITQIKVKMNNSIGGCIIINYPHSFNKDKAKLPIYLKHDNITIITCKYNGKPIVNDCFNHLSSLDDIYAGLDEVFAVEIKPFKLAFRLSGIFEASSMFGGYYYTTELIHWKTYHDTQAH